MGMGRFASSFHLKSQALFVLWPVRTLEQGSEGKNTVLHCNCQCSREPWEGQAFSFSPSIFRSRFSHRQSRKIKGIGQREKKPFKLPTGLGLSLSRYKMHFYGLLVWLVWGEITVIMSICSLLSSGMSFPSCLFKVLGLPDGYPHDIVPLSS